MKFYSPTSLQEAVTLLADHAGSRLCGGGTDVHLLLKQKLEHPTALIDLSRARDLHRFQREKDRFVVGAGLPLSELAREQELVQTYPFLREAVQSIATPVIRKSATVGGNLLVANRCTYYNQSEMWRISSGSCLRESGDICQVTGVAGKCYSRNVSDLAPVLLALDSSVHLLSTEGERTIPLAELYRADGLQAQSGIRSTELMTAVLIPLSAGTGWFRKLRLRSALDFSSLTLAGFWEGNGHFRLVANAVSMAPVIYVGERQTTTLEDLSTYFRRNCKTVKNDFLPLAYRRKILFRWIEDFWNDLQSENNPS